MAKKNNPNIVNMLDISDAISNVSEKLAEMKRWATSRKNVLIILNQEQKEFLDDLLKMEERDEHLAVSPKYCEKYDDQYTYIKEKIEEFRAMMKDN